MPPKAKKNPVHQQGGLAAPGKRIQKPKTNISLPEQLTNGHRRPSSPASSSSDVTPGAFNAIPPDNCSKDGELDRKLDATLASNGSAYHYLSPPNTPSAFPAYPGVAGNPLTHNGNVFTIAATILKTCPLQDVITILIVLLQLPPAFITAVNLLYALLTFIPSSANTSLSSLPSLNDMFLGSGGTPSIYAIVGADLVMLILWSLLWTPAQHFALDLAQAVIAISLGGAAAGRGGTLGTMVWCLAVIIFMHLFRLKSIRQHGLSSAWTDLVRGSGLNANGHPSSRSTSALRHSPSSIRSGLAIHILAQGLVRIIRRWLFRREASQTISPRKKNDPEAAPNIPLPRTNSAGAIDSGPDIGSSASSDGRHPGPSPAAREGREKVLSARKKKRQATHVRSQQPFWAALASTKVSVLKEMEQTQATLDALEANAKDANHVGNANFIMDEDRIWISEVNATEISFGACLIRRDLAFEREENHSNGHSSGIDKSKPFYVRINGADWISTRIMEMRSDLTESELPDREMWVGKIFGLTALSNYYCEFVQVVNDVVIYSTSLITQQAPCDEQAVAATPHSTLRPASPITTLKNTAVQNEKTLNDARNRLKRNRRDHKSSLAAAKREVDSLTSRLASSGGTDDRQRQRVLQLSQSIRVAEEAATALSVQIDEIGEVPADEQSNYDSRKTIWRHETNKTSAARREFDSVRSDADREINNVKAEITNTLQKRERLGLRKSKLDEQYDRLVTTNAIHEDVKQQQARQRALQAADRHRLEQDYMQHISTMRHETNSITFKTQQARAAIEHFENLYHNRAAQQQHFSTPTTPEGPLPGTAGNRALHSPGFASFQFPPMANNFGESHVSTPSSLREGRGRSSSLLSGVSNFTDDMAFVNGGDEVASRSTSSGSPGPISPPTKKPSPVIAHM